MQDLCSYVFSSIVNIDWAIFAHQVAIPTNNSIPPIKLKPTKAGTGKLQKTSK
jgi:hypothetical protein